MYNIQGWLVLLFLECSSFLKLAKWKTRNLCGYGFSMPSYRQLPCSNTGAEARRNWLCHIRHFVQVILIKTKPLKQELLLLQFSDEKTDSWRCSQTYIELCLLLSEAMSSKVAHQIKAPAPGHRPTKAHKVNLLSWGKALPLFHTLLLNLPDSHNFFPNISHLLVLHVFLRNDPVNISG